MRCLGAGGFRDACKLRALRGPFGFGHQGFKCYGFRVLGLGACYKLGGFRLRGFSVPASRVEGVGPELRVRGFKTVTSILEASEVNRWEDIARKDAY